MEQGGLTWECAGQRGLRAGKEARRLEKSTTRFEKRGRECRESILSVSVVALCQWCCYILQTGETFSK